MKLTELFNTTQEKIENKEHNIFVPLCLNNKFFINNHELTPEFKKYVQWALNHTKNKVLVPIADSIQITNYLVRNSTNTYNYNTRKLDQDTKEVHQLVTDCLKENFNGEPVTKISFDEYLRNDFQAVKSTIEIYKEAKNNYEFLQGMKSAVEQDITDRNFSSQKYIQLCDYVIDEMTLVRNGINYQGTHYDMFIYPNTDNTLYFIDSLEEFFPKLCMKMPTRNSAVAILEVD